MQIPVILLTSCYLLGTVSSTWYVTVKDLDLQELTGKCVKALKKRHGHVTVGKELYGTDTCRLLYKQKYPERLGIFSNEDIELGKDITDIENTMCNEVGKISLSESLMQKMKSRKTKS